MSAGIAHWTDRWAARGSWRPTDHGPPPSSILVRSNRGSTSVWRVLLATILRTLRPDRVKGRLDRGLLRPSIRDRGRDAGYPTPPAQIRTSPIKAYGSRL